MKKSFVLFEIIIVILIISLIYSSFTPKKSENKLEELTQRVKLYLNYTRYKALLFDSYNEYKIVDEKGIEKENMWYKQRWTMKFQKCNSSIGGIYFSIYSDKNMAGHINRVETLKDPLTNRYIYANNQCNEDAKDSKYTLITKNFGVEDINISCNSTSSLGQISFGNDGKVYSNLSKESTYEIKSPCTITFFDKNGNSKSIIIQANSGFID